MKKKEYVVVNYTVTFAAPFKFCGVHYLKGIPYCFTAHLAADVGKPGRVRLRGTLLFLFRTSGKNNARKSKDI